MLITKIKLTKKGRYSLYSNSGFLCAVEEQTILDFRIKENTELSEDDIIKIKQNSTLQKAKLKAYAYLSQRAHSAGELHKKLSTVFDADTAQFAVEEMRKLDLIDDEQFAADYSNALLKKNKSSAQIMAALLSKGIDKQLAKNIVQSCCNGENDACFNVLQKKYMQKLNAGESKKVIAALMRRGFKFSEIKSALNRLETQLEDEIEFDESANYDDY